MKKSHNSFKKGVQPYKLTMIQRGLKINSFYSNGP
jgi:hypothetical protein